MDMRVYTHKVFTGNSWFNVENSRKYNFIVRFKEKALKIKLKNIFCNN